jgi:hypothetical protein
VLVVTVMHMLKKRSFAKVEKGKESKESKNGERKLGECNVLPMFIYTPPRLVRPGHGDVLVATRTS